MVASRMIFSDQPEQRRVRVVPAGTAPYTPLLLEGEERGPGDPVVGETRGDRADAGHLARRDLRRETGRAVRAQRAALAPAPRAGHGDEEGEDVEEHASRVASRAAPRSPRNHIPPEKPRPTWFLTYQMVSHARAWFLTGGCRGAGALGAVGGRGGFL